MVSLASHLEAEAASMCSLKAHGRGQLDSQFLCLDSRRGLLARPDYFPELICRLGSPLVVDARLFGPAIFKAVKLRVLFLGAVKRHPAHLPKIYSLTQSDVSSRITLAISREISKAELKGWYSKLQRDGMEENSREDGSPRPLSREQRQQLVANLRFYIFRKELPVVLEALRHGDKGLTAYPELDNSLVWVYFHSNVREYNRVECWGPLVEAAKAGCKETKEAMHHALEEIEKKWSQQRWPGKRCDMPCNCCSRHDALIPRPKSVKMQEKEP